MGQQQTSMAVATEEKGGGTLRHTILVLLAAALMAATLALSALPAMAANSGPGRLGNRSSRETMAVTTRVRRCFTILQGLKGLALLIGSTITIGTLVAAALNDEGYQQVHLQRAGVQQPRLSSK